ncbi:flagellar biosynthetic protein [Oceanimonas sp. GK1]|uniref:flagellar biosynthesis protein FlhB n=1 Tax=Oceanimonas sp. (strain GK1 / IBRC-M 10197) TaxID=511062 RepID=UPI0002494E6A|nr:flagellar biosynthesis protein FlhB [Oceanimonas sp. GK1]AEY02572.1 flagellar biosynthetic protein [Oceanimonas sp. GK1]
MAGPDSSQDKSEQPTEQRKRKARREGQVARSKDLNTLVLLLLGGLVLWWQTAALGAFFRRLFTLAMELPAAATQEPARMLELLEQALMATLWALLPVFLTISVLLVLSGLVPGGLLFSWDSLQPKLSRLNPLSGLKRMFSKQTLVELFKSMLKVSLLGGTLAVLLVSQWQRLVFLGRMPLETGFGQGLGLLVLAVLALCVALALIAIIDVPFQQWSMTQKLKMTKQEVKEEQKNTEGRPEIKQRIRQIQFQMASGRIEQRVPEADVVIVNPTHYAVALKYDPKRAEAPFVIAKGSDALATRIRELARLYDLDIISLPPLTRALYYSTRVDQQVPAGLYSAVAYVLTHVLQLKAWREGRGRRPGTLPEFRIPEKYQH